jgi:hypothetical protein
VCALACSRIPNICIPRVRVVLPSLLLAVATVSIATVVEAQRRREPVPQLRRERPMLAFEASGLFSSVRGQALGTAGDGTGFDVMASVGSGMFALGGGYQRSSHARVGSTNSAIVDGFFIEPRLALPLATGNFTPYVFGRAARLTRALESGTDEPRVSTAIGGGLGTYFWLAENVQLNSAILWRTCDSIVVGSNAARPAAGARRWLTVGDSRRVVGRLRPLGR